MRPTLGYEGPDDLIRKGYELEPEEIRLAVRWLELNDPESAVGLDEVKAKTAAERSMEAARATTGEVLPEGRPPAETNSANCTVSVRASDSGVSVRQQKKLDALARKAPELCQANGKKWNDYKRKKSTKAFFEALSSKTGIPVLGLVQERWGGSSDDRDTWAHPDVATDCAQWISPIFRVQVSQWINELLTTGDGVRHGGSRGWCGWG